MKNLEPIKKLLVTIQLTLAYIALVPGTLFLMIGIWMIFPAFIYTFGFLLLLGYQLRPDKWYVWVASFCYNAFLFVFVGETPVIFAFPLSACIIALLMLILLFLSREDFKELVDF